MITIITWLQYYKLKSLYYIQCLFSKWENKWFIVHVFLSRKHNQSCSKSPYQYGATFTKGSFNLQLEKTYSNFSCQNSNNLWHRQIKKMFLHNPWTHLEKITFDQSFIFKHQVFPFENCCLGGQKMKVKIVGKFHKFWGVGENRNLQWAVSNTNIL